MSGLFKFLFFFIVVSAHSGAFAQNSLIAKGNKEYELYQYINAQKTYLKAVRKGYKSKELFQKLGNTYYFNSQFTEALPWYEKLIVSYGGSVDNEYYYKYAQTLKSAGNYKKSELYMRAFAKINPKDNRAKLFLKSQKKLEKSMKLQKKYTIRNLSMNSLFRDFGASYFGKFIVFSTSRNEGSKKDLHEWNKEPYLDMFIATVDDKSGELYEIERWNHSLNSDLHESSPIFTKDNQTVYFTGNEVEDKDFKKRKRDKVKNIKTNNLKIYKSSITKSGEWSTPEILPFCLKGYSTAHPTLNTQETKMYFSSNMPGGKGESDIYEIDVLPDGSFGKPINLGDVINTEGKETFPFISADNELYFSSNGHLGIGGLDIFVADITEKIETERVVVNIGEPLNSKGDDFGFVMNDVTKKGYFASNRKEGRGKDDIYSFVQIEEEIIFEKGDDLAIILNLDPIYFDLDKSFIRPDAEIVLDEIVTIMKKHPNIKIDIRSHTDSRALMWYNNRLSDRRAKSTKKYLIQMGISSERLTSKGYGEYELVNRCGNGVKCSEEEHQLNRRSEFIITDQ